MGRGGPAGLAGGALVRVGLVVRAVLSCGVPDGCDHQVQVPVVQAGDGVAQADRKAGGDAGGELEDAPFAAFSELCRPSCKVGMSHQVTAAARGLQARCG